MNEPILLSQQRRQQSEKLSIGLVVTVPSEVGHGKWLLSLFPYDRILKSPKFSVLSLSDNWLKFPSQKFKNI